MNRFDSYLSASEAIINSYDGSQPFAVHLKSFFRNYRKAGSSDRKHIIQTCYNYFRLGKSLDHLSKRDQMITSLFLCASQPGPMLAYLAPSWNNHLQTGLSAAQKLEVIRQHYPDFKEEAIFPFTTSLSNQIERLPFSLSHLQQPDLFVRVRPGKYQLVSKKIQEAGIHFVECGKDCLAFANGTRIDQLLQADQDIVVQDLNSQRVGEFLQMIPQKENTETLTLWDCCAGSGGKSLLAQDMMSNLKITVSDKRKNVLENLRERFSRAGIRHFELKAINLEQEVKLSELGKFDIIIADVPCTGSGTWGRTPEYLRYFNESELPVYTKRQQAIVRHASPFLRRGGYFLYITCSVFKDENEEMLSYIQRQCGLQLLNQSCLTGYDHRADTLFAALFIAS